MADSTTMTGGMGIGAWAIAIILLLALFNRNGNGSLFGAEHSMLMSRECITNGNLLQADLYNTDKLSAQLAASDRQRATEWYATQTKLDQIEIDRYKEKVNDLNNRLIACENREFITAQTNAINAQLMFIPKGDFGRACTCIPDATPSCK